MDTEVNQDVLDPEVTYLRMNKESAYAYRERRGEDWEENYTLYRDKVLYNRLTQRQSVNMPLMKQTVRTLLKDVDDMPVVYFKSRDNNAEKEIFQNEYWKWTLEQNNMELQDIIDKKQVMLFGRTFDQMQIRDGKIALDITDPSDMLIDRYVNPSDIDSARFLIHTHIFVPLSDLEKNPDYDQKKVKELKTWHASRMGLLKSKQNEQMLLEKNKKMANLGLDDVDDPILGETYVELSLHFVYDTREGSDEEELFLKVEVDDMQLIFNKPLEEVIGTTDNHYWRTHFPYNTWADDLEKQDFWSDGVADIIRTPNKVLNTWFSQLVENRTLRNFGMHYYNSNLEGFEPQTWNPVAWGWYGIPVPADGKLSEVMQKVDIPDLSESLDEMSFLIEMAERASGATATQQGVQTERQLTLGEVQLALGEAKERIKGMSKFNTHAWKQRAEKFLMFIEAASDKLDAVKLYKSGRQTSELYEKEVEPKDWMSRSGYETEIWSQDDKDTQDTRKLERINLAVTQMPYNIKLRELYQRKLLEFSELQPDEINEIIQAEQERVEQEQMMQEQMMATQGMVGQPQPAPQPAQPAQPIGASRQRQNARQTI
jgi:hypothetical protein